MIVINRLLCRGTKDELLDLLLSRFVLPFVMTYELTYLPEQLLYVLSLH